MNRGLWAMAAVLGAVLGLAGQVSAARVEVDFESAQVGHLPEGFGVGLTGEGGAARWEVAVDQSAPAGRKVLVEKSVEDKSYRFPLCVYEKLQAKDVTVSVAFKPVAGEIDQAAGIVVRLTDPNNYYIVRANALEDNVRLYKIEGGKRKQFAGAEKIKTPANQWHTLSLKVAGSRFEVSLNGQRLFEAEDTTFQKAGKVGLWTKADSLTHFDRLVIEGE